MSTERQVTFRDLVEEAKKRIVFLVMCVVGLSYLMSLTSASVLVNLPAAASLIIIIRYLSLDFEMRRKAAAYSSKKSSINNLPQKNLPEGPKVVSMKSDWRRKIDSPVVEDAIDRFTRHLISEWVTDLWYSRLTPDKEGPEELVQILNGVLGELSHRAKNVNLIDLLTRDIINLIGSHLELFRASQAKIESHHLQSLTIDQRDIELKLILAIENKLHPALFSNEAEHKVLQHLMDSLISFTFNPKDLQCSFFRYTVRELLACAVIRPVLNLASPRFINERIESLVLSASKAGKGTSAAEDAHSSKANSSANISPDDLSRLLDPSVTGVELVQLKIKQPQDAADKAAKFNVSGSRDPKDPLLSTDAHSTRSWGSLPSDSNSDSACSIQRHCSGGEWGDMLDLMSHRKTQALAPEHVDNLWTKGRNYKTKENLIDQVNRSSVNVDHSTFGQKEKYVTANPNNGTAMPGVDFRHDGANTLPMDQNISSSFIHSDEDDNPVTLDEGVSDSDSSHTTEEEETTAVTGLDSPGTKVWDGKKNRNITDSHIHHPLESTEGNRARKSSKGHIHHQTLSETHSGRKKCRLNSQKVHVWQEVQRASLTSGDGHDIYNPLEGHTVAEDSSDDSEIDRIGRVSSGASASSSASLSSFPQNYGSVVDSGQNYLLSDSFFRLRCEVLGANIVKSGSKMLAVYSISVTDVNNNTWSIKRRFRHFEELHRRLKEFPEYNLHLPPKHFLSTGLDMLVIKERCQLLDKYLKRLLQFPTISGSIEVWDFLSVDSQTYMFLNSISIVETLSVDLNNKPPKKAKEVADFRGPLIRSSSKGPRSKESMQIRPNVDDGTKSGMNILACSEAKKPNNDSGRQFNDSSSDSRIRTHKIMPPNRELGKAATERVTEGSPGMLIDVASNPSIPSEWVPPNLSVPILDMVDVVLQLQDGGWIRRKVFWVAKQVLQLGMGDAFDDWLIEKIQLLRRGSVVASGIKRVEQILWPDGIFITKHPNRQQPPSHVNSTLNKCDGHEPLDASLHKKDSLQKQHGEEKKQHGEESSLSLDEHQKREANRRAKFVYELMIENAPAAIVGLIGRKEYEHCAKDVYFFLQSSVFIKQLAFDLLELLLLSAFPEFGPICAQLHEEKLKFGVFKENK